MVSCGIRCSPAPSPRPCPGRSIRPFVLSDVRIDRDLYYRPTILDPINQYPENGRTINGLGFGTDILNPGRIEADQFVLGDNSAASRDGRIWEDLIPWPRTAAGDDTPSVSATPDRQGVQRVLPRRPPLGGWRSVVPDFGRLRFIR